MTDLVKYLYFMQSSPDRDRAIKFDMRNKLYLIGVCIL